METAAVLLVLAGIVALILRTIARRVKEGKSLACGGDCSRCLGDCAERSHF